MEWIKRGKIFENSTFNLSWFQKNAMMPVPYRLNQHVLRLFVTMCDSNNVGRIGYVDVEAHNPSHIVNVSKEPVVDIGEPGKYDDNGVVSASIFEKDNVLYLFYSAYQLCKKIPYMIFSGVAVSKDHGDSFQKISCDVPFLDRINGEVNFRAVPNVIQQGTTFKMWYLADSKLSAWIDVNDKLLPCYITKYMESEDLFNWNGSGVEVFEFDTADEHGLSIGSIWLENDLYKCIYSIRSISHGYRLGYAISKDGKKFQRRDAELNLDVTPGEFDSEMMCFPKRIEIDGRIYLFYSGNHYGIGGIGYAEEVAK